MQNRGIVLSLVAGLVLGVAHIAAAQTGPAVPPSVSTASTTSTPRTVELRLLTPDGKLIGRVTIETPEVLSVTANRFTSSSEDTGNLIRLQGNVSLKLRRNGVTMTVLETKGEDVVVEYRLIKAAQAGKAGS